MKYPGYFCVLPNP